MAAPPRPTTRPNDAQLPDQATSLGRRPLRRRDAHHVRPLLPAAGRPGPARGRQVGDGRGRRARVAPARARPSRARAVRALPEAARGRPLPRPLVREPQDGQRDGRSGDPGHGRARPRRRDPLDADRAADRNPLGAAAAIAARPRSHDLHPHRDLRARGVDRPPAAVLRRLQMGADAERGLLRRLRPAGRDRRAEARRTGPTT